MRPSRAQAVVGVLLAVLGFAAVTQVRANEVDNTYASYREQDLIDLFNSLAGATERAQSELAQLERRRRDLESTSRRRGAALAQARQDLDTYGILAGVVPVSGPGIRVTITESSGPADIGALLDAVQELRTAGAEAMAFNGEVRLVAQSSFERGEGGILVDGVLLESPYVLDVIGEPNTLEGGLVFPSGPVIQLERDGATVEIERPATVTIDVVREGEQPRFAEADEPE